ncbi:LiaF transmembrane domain-containing protein [Mesoaciditoga sp.]
MKAFSVFLVLAGILLFLSLFGFVNMTFGFVMEILFATLFGVEGIRELISKNLVGIGGLLFSAYILVRAFDLFSFSSTSKAQIFMAFIASYLIGIGIQMLFKKSVKVKFWENQR